jgi:Nuclease-related domain
MAWPKPKNRRSPVPTAAVGNSGGAAPDGTRIHVAPADQAETPSWRAPRRWPGSHATVTPGPAQAQPGPAETEEPDPGDAPFWEGWAPADESIGLDDPGDGLPEDGPADDAVTDVDPRPRPSWEPVVAAAGEAREEPKAEGIGQHLGSLAHLSANPRRRAWQRRIIVAVIFGVGFGFWLNDWRWGLTFAVLAAIADTIIRSRTTFNGPAGVKLTGAQKHTVRQLSRLERKGYRAMHILPIPDSTEQIDHLVIGPAGVFAIDSEDWDRRMPVRTSSHRNLWHGPTNMKDRLEHAHWEAGQAAELLSAAAGSPVAVRPVLAVYGPKIMWDVAEIRDVDVFSGPRLRKYLRRRAKKRDAHPLSASEIERIDKAAHAVFPQAPAS